MILEWILIISLSILSLSATISFYAYQLVPKQQTFYYYVQQQKIKYLSHIFQYVYLVIGPLIFFICRHQYQNTVVIASLMIIVSSCGRWIAEKNYDYTLICTVILAISYVLILNASFTIIKLIKPIYRAYAIFIPLYLPLLGIKHTQEYEYVNIRQQYPEQHLELIDSKTNQLNLNIFILGLIGGVGTIVLMRVLKNSINKINQKQDKQNIQTSTNTKQTNQIKYNSNIIYLITIGLGSIFGISMTYEKNCLIFYQNTQISKYQVLLLNRNETYSLLIVSGLFIYMIRRYKLPAQLIVYCTNLLALISCLYLQLSVDIYPEFNSNVLIVITVYLVKLGYIAILPQAIVKLYQFYDYNLIFFVFFYTFTLVHIVTQYFVEVMDYTKSFGIMFFIAWFGIYVCYFLSPGNGMGKLDGELSNKRSQYDI